MINYSYSKCLHKHEKINKRIKPFYDTNAKQYCDTARTQN